MDLRIYGASIHILITLPVLLLTGWVLLFTGWGIWICFKVMYKKCRWCLFAGLYFVIVGSLLSACILPIMTKYNSDQTTVKRNNLLVATLVPLVITIIGYSIVIWIPFIVKRQNWNFGEIWWWVSTLVRAYLVLAISIPVGLEFGLRFESTPSICGISDECPEHVGIQKDTIIALGVIAGLPSLLLIGWAIWCTIKRIYKCCYSATSPDLPLSDEVIAIIIPTALPLVTNAPPMEANELSDTTDQQQRHSVNMHESQFQPILVDERREGETEGSPECTVCMDKESTILLKPCMHLCMCKECWIIYKRDRDCCPICRGKLKMSDIEEINVCV